MTLSNHTPFRVIICSVLMATAQPLLGEVIFQEDFDEQPDFTSTMHGDDNPIERTKGDTLPVGWDKLYQGTQWSPETGYPDNHASLEILASNPDKARGGEGKSAVNWRESYSKGWNNWASDSHLIKVLDREYQELYIEFYVRFSQNWWQRDPGNVSSFTSKLFRIGHWSGEGSIFNSQTGDVNPRVFWDYKMDKYGVRNFLAFRHGPPGVNEKMPQEGSYNYANHLSGQEVGGGDPALLDQTDLSTRLVDLRGPVMHEQVFGPTEKWTKMGFYVRMNSAPGAKDGVFRQWMDGERIVNFENVEWIKDYPGSEMVGWNYFAIGGNDYFQPYPNEERFEDWYAIDNLVVATEPPQMGNAPNPPGNISVSK